MLSTLPVKRMLALFQSNATKGYNRMLLAFNGPLKSGCQTAAEIIRLVIKEQQLKLPDPQTWPHAKQQYMQFVDQMRPKPNEAWLWSIFQYLGERKWQEVGSGMVTVLQIAAYYYMAQFFGRTVGWPLRLVSQKNHHN